MQKKFFAWTRTCQGGAELSPEIVEEPAFGGRERNGEERPGFDVLVGQEHGGILRGACEKWGSGSAGVSTGRK